MSKQSEAKKAQNYKTPNEVGMCHNCEHYASSLETTPWGGKKERHMRCTLGGFAVKKTASCDLQIDID